jgi:TRAP-type C4-dicarboxylate transport system substrate-binding protein
MRFPGASRIDGSVRFRTFFVAALAVLVSVPALAQAPRVMKLSTATLNDVQHEWFKRFAAEVEKNAGGRIRAEIYPASQLGQIPQQIQSTQFGSIQAWSGPPQFLAGIDKRCEILSAPGVFRDADHANRTLQDAEFNSAFLQLGGNKGLRGVGLFVTGEIGIATRTRVVKLADLEGKKIRVLASDMEREQMRRLKATPVPMPLGEVLPALQQGALDGVMSTLPVISALRFYDSTKFFLQTDHAMISVITVMSKSWLDELPKDLQKMVLDAGQKVSREIQPWAKANYEEHRQVWRRNGGEIHQLSAAERKELTRVMAPIGPQVTAADPGQKELYALMLRVAKRREEK